MGPGFFFSPECAACWRSIPAKPSFNGAGLLRPRMLEEAARSESRLLASMGPGLVSPECGGVNQQEFITSKLQWGRASSARIASHGSALCRRRWCFNGAGLRQPGSQHLLFLQRAQHLASMGPGFFSPECAVPSPAFSRAHRCFNGAGLLQPGMQSGDGNGGAGERGNGAGLRQPGCPDNQRRLEDDRLASMGPGFVGPDRAPCARAVLLRAVASMGPGFVGPDRCRTRKQCMQRELR